jgi:anti-sigma-K factor RskA
MIPPSPPSGRPAQPLDENDLLAAEYALGVLEAGDRARIETMAKGSPAFAARIAAWEARLSPMADDIPPMPAPNVLPQIESRLFGVQPTRQLRTWARSLMGLGLTAAASVVALALFLQIAPLVDSPEIQTQSTTLAADGSDLIYLAQRLDGQIILTRTAGPAPASGRSYELWVIDGDKPAVSLGLIDAALSIPEPMAAAGYVLAITDEPLGGGPNGVATGDVIALGHFAEN